MCMCLCRQSWPLWVQVPAIGIQKRALEALELELHVMWATRHGCWELFRPLQEQLMLSPAEPSLQPWVVHLQPAPPSMSSLCSKWRSLPLVSQFLMLKNYILLRTVSPPPRFPFPLVYLCELFSSVVTFLKAARLPGHQHFTGLISCSFAAFISGWHRILLLKPMTLALAGELGKGTGEFISLGLQSQSSALHWGPSSSLLSRSIAKTIAEFLSLSKDLEARITFNRIYSFENVSECAVVCMWRSAHNSQDLVCSFRSVGPGDQTHVIKSSPLET